MTVNVDNMGDLQDAVRIAMRKAFHLGQVWWQQADSENVSQHKKADATQAKFDELVDSIHNEVGSYAAPTVATVVQAPIACAKQPFPAPAVQSGELHYDELTMDQMASKLGIETRYAAMRFGFDTAVKAISQTALAVQSPNKANTVESLTDLYLSLTDAMEYNSGKNGMEWSAEEWAAHLVAHYKATSNAAPTVATGDLSTTVPSEHQLWNAACAIRELELEDVPLPDCMVLIHEILDPYLAAPSPTEQASYVRNAALEECAVEAENAICDCCWEESAREAADYIASQIRALKSATPAEAKGNQS